MRSDEARVIAAFERHLINDGWTVTREVEFCDLVAERDRRRLFVEAKGRTAAPGLDVDTMYGQILRRMPLDADDTSHHFAVVVPTGAAKKAELRVPARVRQLLRIAVYAIDEVVESLGHSRRSRPANTQQSEALPLRANRSGATRRPRRCRVAWRQQWESAARRDRES
jgi:hypothetical protein